MEDLSVAAVVVVGGGEPLAVNVDAVSWVQLQARRATCSVPPGSSRTSRAHLVLHPQSH